MSIGSIFNCIAGWFITRLHVLYKIVIIQLVALTAIPLSCSVSLMRDHWTAEFKTSPVLQRCQRIVAMPAELCLHAWVTHNPTRLGWYLEGGKKQTKNKHKNTLTKLVCILLEWLFVSKNVVLKRRILLKSCNYLVSDHLAAIKKGGIQKACHHLVSRSFFYPFWSPPDPQEEVGCKTVKRSTMFTAGKLLRVTLVQSFLCTVCF